MDSFHPRSGDYFFPSHIPINKGMDKGKKHFMHKREVLDYINDKTS